MALYAIRHGQTDWNVNHLLQGRTDVDLNKTGIEQAKEAAENLKDVKIDLIICSTLKRAKQTAAILNKVLNTEIIYNNDLRERGFGMFEGGNINELWQQDIFKSGILYNYKENLHYKDIEPIRDLCARVWKVIDNVKNAYRDKNVLLVTHGGTMNAVFAYFNGFDEDGGIRYPVSGNCELKRFEFKDE